MGPRVLTHEQRRIALTMAALGSILPVVIVTVDDFTSHGPAFLVGAALAAAAPVGSILASPHRRWLRWPFAFSGLPGLTLLQAETGGVASPYAILLVMGMVWFGLMASDGELRAGIAVTVACCFVPMIVIGAPAYPVEPALALTLALVNCSVLLGLAATTRQTVRLTQRLRHDANHDRLTGLLNRRGWDDAVDTHFGRKPPVARPRVVALIDLDQLKKVNDTLGHDRGDELLRSIADGLRETFAHGGVVSRLGGDEFAVLVVDRSEDDVVRMLADLRTACGADGAFSAGVVTVQAGDAPGDIMRRAGLALYEAKTTGRNRTCVAGEPLSDALAHACGHGPVPITPDVMAGDAAEPR
jgi:diguanylate cyclase (GGDEF)-like protein